MMYGIFHETFPIEPMSNEKIFSPVQYKGVMVSSTFADLETHRQELMKALRKEELVAIGMEDYVPVPGDDIISSSLGMVRKGSAYIGLISRRYGQIIEDPDRNPDLYSVSRLEFEEAQRLRLPTLIFVMGENHPVTESGVELDAEKREKLKEYRELAKEGRIYVEFDSLEDFNSKAIHAVARLGRYLREQDAASPNVDPPPSSKAGQEANPIPSPPAFYAEPPYIGSHNFVGRKAELDRLSDWASPADPHPILLFEAIGGTGKSMLTWEWVNKYSVSVRNDWAGIFWYSFYEKGAIMSDFCQRALAYITGKPLKDFRKKKITELGELLLRHLQDRPWLLVLDGLERVLVAYHRIDAAQIADEEVDTAEDQIAKRDPCAGIRPEDDDFLRMLAAAVPSKVLITTRLTPRVLLSPSSQGIPGVLRVPLPGLRPQDAEELLRACGISGTSREIQDYLKSHCDCHPLVTGVLAGLVNDYLPDRGNFDAWASDSAEGGQLDLANLDLIQKRNHILLSAFSALPEKSRQLLSTLSLLSESVDSETLNALNPHVSALPEEVEEPENPEQRPWWPHLSEEIKNEELKEFGENLQKYAAYVEAQGVRSRELPTATKELTKTVRDIEKRGLLQYDHQSKHYDLHPVVRGFAAGTIGKEDKQVFGQRVVDHFSRRAHSSYEEAESLENLRDTLNVVRALIQMGQVQKACDIFVDELSNALIFNLEAWAEILSIVQSVSPRGMGILPDNIFVESAKGMANTAAIALTATGDIPLATVYYEALVRASLKELDFVWLVTGVHNLGGLLVDNDRLAAAERLNLLVLEMSILLEIEEDLFTARLGRFDILSLLGRFPEAESFWTVLDSMGRDWPRWVYRSGALEEGYARFRFFQGTLDEGLLVAAETLCKTGKNRSGIRILYALRGKWQIERKEWALAAESLNEAVRMAREVGENDVASEALLCLAKFNLGQLAAPVDEALQLAKAKKTPRRILAELWFAIGDGEQAKDNALNAYKDAWAEGEPYVYRYELDKARELLKKLGVEIPDLPPYDPEKDKKFPWEDDLAAAIEKLRSEKEAANKDE